MNNRKPYPTSWYPPVIEATETRFKTHCMSQTEDGHHALEMHFFLFYPPHADVNRMALEWNPRGSRRRGRPNSTWKRSVHMEAKAVGLNWNGVKVVAKNKVRWRCVVDALCYRKHWLKDALGTVFLFDAERRLKENAEWNFMFSWWREWKWHPFGTWRRRRAVL
jgi:hypothetical protein